MDAKLFGLHQMTAEGHATEAEKELASVRFGDSDSLVLEHLLKAQVHATLALVKTQSAPTGQSRFHWEELSNE